jgi:Flp pilus assembly protein TadD
MKTAFLLLGLCLLCACQSLGGGTLGASDKSAPGVDASAEDVDGLIVGHRLLEAGEPELALKAYYRAAAQQGINSDVLSAIGSANLALGRLGQAEQVLRRALDEEPTFVPALNNLGVVLMEQGKAPEAKNVFQQAYALDSGNSDAIRENLIRAIAMSEKSIYADEPEQQKLERSFSLVRRGQGENVLLSSL